MKDDRPSRRVVEQRVRNRIIEHLDLAASYDEQAAYETAVPFVNVPYEVINGWGDWLPIDPREDAADLDVFSADEIHALCDFQGVLDVAAEAVPNDYPQLADVQALPEWDRLRTAALKARQAFAVRGKMPEDREVAD